MDMVAMLEAHRVDLTTITAWVPCYFPFTMGGHVWRPGGAKLECDRPVQFGEFVVCVVHGPDGMTAVCELSTGAIVGETLQAVETDIEEAYARGDVRMMRDQIEQARTYMDERGFTDLGADEFWRRLRLARERKGAV